MMRTFRRMVQRLRRSEATLGKFESNFALRALASKYYVDSGCRGVSILSVAVGFDEINVVETTKLQLNKNELGFVGMKLIL